MPLSEHTMDIDPPEQGSSTETPNFDLDYLNNIEQHFYDRGHEEGFAHGRIHGQIEGRQFGREKGFELWEEVGFYEGFAQVWRALLIESERAHQEAQGQEPEKGHPSRALHHIDTLLGLISRFPTVNPTPSEPDPPDPTHLPTPPPEEVDIPALLAQIRARYKALCASLGTKPRLAVAGSAQNGAGTSSSPGQTNVPKLGGRSLAF